MRAVLLASSALGAAVVLAALWWALARGAASRPSPASPAPPPAARRPEAPPPPPPRPREAERRWLSSRRAPEPLLAYLLGGSEETLEPLGGSLPGQAAGRYRLRPSGSVYLTSIGAVFFDGGRLVCEEAGRELSRRLAAAGCFSVEALVVPADRRHGGPARLVSISYDAGLRNFTLAQEGDDWVVRIRTTRTGPNGTNPQAVHAGRLEPCRTHVVVTYDGARERLYLDGEEVPGEGAVEGGLGGWDERFALILGNEVYDRRDWAGVIRFVAFYERALSPAEVRRLFRALPPGGPAPGRRPLPPPAKPPLEERPASPPVEVEDIF